MIPQLLAGVRAAMAAQRPAEAERLLRQILSIDPNSLEALMTLAPLLLAANRVAEAAAAAERAIRLNPNLGPPHFHLGQCRLREGRFTEASDELEVAAKISPNLAPIQHLLGIASQQAGRGKRAEECFRRSIALDPAAPAPHAELGQLLLAKGDQQGALDAFRKSADLQPGSAFGQFLLGRALVEGDRFAEGEEHLRRAIQMDPRLADARTLLARAMQQQGRFDAAEDLLKAQTDESQGFYVRVNGRRMTEQDRPMLERMEQRVKSLDPVTRRTAFYALGKGFDDLGEYERAMRHFDRANRLSQERLNSQGRIFDADALRMQVDEIIARQSQAQTGDPSDKPIFIVGMARSGTTLLEQIVSNHPDVRAAGELGTWAALNNADFDTKKEAEKLLAKLNEIAPGAQRVTIKTPQNYMIIGPILSVFPNARFLHCRRNPIDTCLSIYTTSFQSGPEFAHNRASLVAAYREYLRIMEHWRRVISPMNMMDLDYEQLVADREPVLRDIFGFLGLPWDNAVMRHEDNEHAISTPSLWQARQPVFDRSVGRWRNYEPWLGELLEL